MADFICAHCSSAVQADEACQFCNPWAAIVTPQVKATPAPVASDGAFSEGLPPEQRVPRLRVPPRGMGWVVYAIVGASILAVSVVLVVPAVQKARAAAARTQSTNNLKNIALAGHTFHDIQKHLPFNGSAAAPYSLEAKAKQFTSGSWGFQIAPYVDQRAMFAAGKSDSGIALYMCPGRGRPMTTSTPSVGATTPPWSDYVINPWLNESVAGGGITTISAAPDLKRTLVGITDGTSNTIFFGHGQINTSDYATSAAEPGYLDTILIGGTTATALSGNPTAGPVTFARDNADSRKDAARGWGGPFEQGCLMCMCDATVRLFPYSTGVGTFSQPWQSAGIASFLTPTGGEVFGHSHD